MQYQTWLERQRCRTSLYNVLQGKISNIAKFIVAGGDPSSDPGYKDDYAYLIGEFGEGIFESEIKKLRLMKEEDEYHG